MKRALKNRFATMLAILGAAAVLSGCGKSDPNEVPPGGAPGGVPGVPGVPGPGACIPLASHGGYNQANGLIGINAMNIFWDGRKIVAGQVPGGQAVGQVMIGQGGASGGPYTRSGVDGVLSLQITQNPGGGGYPQPGYYPQYPGTPSGATTANATGMLQISQATLQDIMNQFGGGMYGGGGYQQPYNPYYPTQPGMTQPYQPQTCVSAMAIDGLWAPNGGFYNTWVYLYMNNTQHGYKLYF